MKNSRCKMEKQRRTMKNKEWEEDNQDGNLECTV
jgi:hypothetical protein